MRLLYRKAFTMIELIFVIVIIGILASIAIPKLSATRDDAQAIRIVANTKIFLKDLLTYYTAKGEKNYIKANVGGITSVKLHTDTGCSNNIENKVFRGKTIYICADSIPLVKITSNGKNNNQTVTLEAYGLTTTLGTMLQTNSSFKKLVDDGSGEKKYLLTNSDVDFD